MAKTVKVVTTDADHPVRWPHYCVECGAKDDLALVSIKVTDVKAVKPWMLLLGRIHAETHTLEMVYPTPCIGVHAERHHDGCIAITNVAVYVHPTRATARFFIWML